MKDKFISISNESQGLFKDKGSRFIAYAYPVSSEEEVKALIKELTAKHHGARHVCYAYRIFTFGKAQGKWRANDDGEPSGTAGRPILGQIDSAGLSNVLVAVVRYFGGILLGVPGLINAYRSAAADAIANAEKVEKTATVWRQIEFTYENMPMVESFIKAQGLTAKNREFSEHCSMEVEIPLSLHDKIVKKLKKSVTFKENSDKSI